MRLALGLLLFFLGVTMSREMSAEQVSPSDNATIVRGDNQFAVDLYAQLDRQQPGKNLFFSPTSISLALAMTAAGARGPTQAEMAKALHLDADLAQAHARYHQLLEQWNAVGEKRAYQLRVANRLWGQTGYPIRPEFLALTRQQYGAEMLLSNLPVREVNTYLPKFKLETSFELNPTLVAMGMKRAFSGEADFSGISSTEALYISVVLHKAYVDVNEEGTEAAAATGVVMRAMAARRPQPVPVFRADHPFLFLIRDTRAGSVLFMGRLTNPSK